MNDTPEILDLFRDLLEEEGYRVSTNRFSVVAQETFAALTANRPDLVILDFMIGGENLGWQFLQMMKMDPATADLPVLICTDAVDRVRELQAHLDELGIGVVLKPFEIPHLLRAIDRVWERAAERERSRPTGGNSA